MIGTSCSPEFSERILTEHRNPEKTEEIMTQDLSKDASSSGVSTESLRMESTPCLSSLTAWSKKGVFLTI